MPLHCPGARVDQFTLEKVYRCEIDFVNGQWTRDYTPLWKQMRKLNTLESRGLWNKVMAMPSMGRERASRGY